MVVVVAGIVLSHLVIVKDSGRSSRGVERETVVVVVGGDSFLSKVICSLTKSKIKVTRNAGLRTEIFWSAFSEFVEAFERVLVSSGTFFFGHDLSQTGSYLAAFLVVSGRFQLKENRIKR